MEKKVVKKLFLNYLRELYIELSKKDLESVKEVVSKITTSSWCMVAEDFDFIKGVLCYFLVSKKCPDYKICNTVSLVEARFEEEENIAKNLIEYSGILIIRHSCTFIRNKLMLETLLYILSERSYKGKRTIVVSNILQDKGEYVYYDHSLVQKYIPSVGLEHRYIVNPSIGATRKSTVPTSRTSCRPLANMNLNQVKAEKEQKLKTRMKYIEEGSKNAV